MTILPLVYYGSTEYWSALVNGGEDVIIDIGEHYVKRSDRNRTEIMTSGGVMQLSVQLCHANKPRQPMQKMEIDYSKRWQHQHFVAIESAYRSSPYYDHYAHLIESLYSEPWERLVDLNLATLKAICRALKLPLPKLSTEYVRAAGEDVDMRDKKRGSTFVAEPYIQVFCDRLPFTPNLSILDLLMCEGPEAINVLRHSKL
jgi:hypothetical protein